MQIASLVIGRAAWRVLAMQRTLKGISLWQEKRPTHEGTLHIWHMYTYYIGVVEKEFINIPSIIWRYME